MTGAFYSGEGRRSEAAAPPLTSPVLNQWHCLPERSDSGVKGLVELHGKVIKSFRCTNDKVMQVVDLVKG